MARGSGFSAFGKNFIIVGNAQHRIFGLRFGYLIRATTSFFCALTPVPRGVNRQDCEGRHVWGNFRILHSVSSISLARHVLSDEGETHGPPFRERRTFRNWRRIGTITFDRAVVSYNGDFVIHFHHPTWRDDQNDPATATRVNERKVR